MKFSSYLFIAQGSLINVRKSLLVELIEKPFSFTCGFQKLPGNSVSYFMVVVMKKNN